MVFLEKIKLGYEMASLINIWMVQIVAAIGIKILCQVFFQDKKKSWVSGIAYLSSMMILYYIPIEMNNFVAYLMGIFVAFMTMYYLERERKHLLIFLAITFFVIRWIGVSMSANIGNLLSDVLSMKIEEVFFKENGEKMEIAFLALFCLVNIVDNILNYIVLRLFAYGMGRFFRYKQEEINKKELCLLSIPSCLGVLNYAIVLRYNHVFEEETRKYLSDVHKDIQLLWSLYDLLLIAVILGGIILFQYLKQKQEDDKEQCILENQINDMQIHIQKVEQIYSGIRGVKHDIRNHVSILRSLMEQQNYEEAEKYLAQLQSTVEQFDFKIKTGNPITDIILNEKAQEAENKQITFESKFYYPVETKINAFDLSIILNNALANAIEAVGEDGNVKIRSFRNKNAYFISVINSYDGIVNVNEITGLPISSKSNQARHGFGIKNIKSVAEKYFGDLEIVQEQGQVKVTIMLMIS